MDVPPFRQSKCGIEDRRYLFRAILEFTMSLASLDLGDAGTVR